MVNVSGETVGVLNGQQKIATLPPGFVGPLDLTGSHTVVLNGTLHVSTNVINSGEGNGIGTVSGVNNSGVPGFFGIGLLSPGNYIFDFTPLGESPHVLLLGAIPFGQSATYTLNSLVFTPLSATNFVPEVWSGSWSVVPWPGTSITTNYVTNVISGQLLGTFNAQSTTKGVTIMPTEIELHGYQREIQAVSVGFGLAATVLVFSFILRLFRAIPSQGGDF